MGATDYIVSARKYRPSTFESVVGQKWLTATLKSAIQSGKLAHSYLFCGPRGVGKTTCARIFAKTINCQHLTENGEACGECESCRTFNQELRSYNVFELDAASNNSVDDIRHLTEQVNIPPMEGSYKVYVIDEVHMLSTAAFNAFLKTLEEPPKYAIFILATTEKQKIIPTILSRCQVYDFQRITNQDIADHLKYVAEKENISYQPEALDVIAEKADGGMRDALSIFDQVANFTHNNITYAQTVEHLNVIDTENYLQMTDLLIDGNIPQSLVLLDRIISKGFEPGLFIAGLMRHFRNLLMSKDQATVNLIETSAEMKRRYAEQAVKVTPKYLYKAIKLCCDCDLNYKSSKNRRLLVELTLIQLAQANAESDVPADGLGPTQVIKPIFNTQQPAHNQAQQVTANKAVEQPTPAPTERVAYRFKQPEKKSEPVETAKSTANLFVSISGNTPKAKTATAATAKSSSAQQKQTQETENLIAIYKPLNADMLDFHWREIAQKIASDKVALFNRMLNSMPQITGPNTIVIPVFGTMAKESLSEISDKIISELQSVFGPQISMSIEVQNEIQSERLLSPKEQLEAMRKDNPDLKLMEEMFQLTL